jgi:hypothetical protein
MTTIADGSYLGRMLALVSGRDTAGALADGAERVAAAARRAGASGLERPWAPGKWTGRQVLAHLADAEMGIGFRVRQVLSQEGHVMQEFDETAWMGLYRDVDVEAALAAFQAGRRWMVHFVRQLAPAELARVGVHPSRGEETVETSIRALAGHTFSHAAQIEKLSP